MSDFIRQLISEGEHQQLDFKFELSDAKKIARSLVAFANTDGGKLLVGVKDNGAVVGVKSDEEAYMIETAALLYTKPELSYKMISHIVNGKTVLEVQIAPSESKPHFAPDKNNQWTAYIRIADENQIANKVIVKVWKRLSGPKGVYLKYTDAEKELLTYVEEYGEVTFLKARQVLGVSARKVENILANFIAIGILEFVFEDKIFKYQIRTTGNFTF